MCPNLFKKDHTTREGFNRIIHLEEFFVINGVECQITF